MGGAAEARRYCSYGASRSRTACLKPASAARGPSADPHAASARSMIAGACTEGGSVP
jgi:hypothetical protein